MTINPMHHIVLYVEGEGATTNNNPNLPPSHNWCKPPWHTTIQPSPSILPHLLHPSSSKCTLIHYTHCSTGPMEAARSFLNMRLMNGVRSMLIDFRLTTSYQSPARRWLTTNILHCQPYSYHIKIMYFWNCRYTNLEKKGPRLPIHCYLNT